VDFFCLFDVLFNFAGDNSLYAIAKLLYDVVSILQCEVDIVIELFKLNSISANTAKFQLMFLGNRIISVGMKVEKGVLKSTDCVILLVVYIDHKLNFATYV